VAKHSLAFFKTASEALCPQFLALVMSGIPETISADLARYFHRKLIIAKPAVDFVRAEPEGYNFTFDSESERAVIRHIATGIRVAVDALDLVERVDRRSPSEPTRIVFLYMSVASGHMPQFTEVARLANARPREAWKVLVKHGFLRPVEESADAAGLQSPRTTKRGPSWYTGAVTLMDPAHVFRRTEHRVMARTEEPWHGADFCIAFHTFARCIKPFASGGPEVMQLQDPIGLDDSLDDFVEVDYGVQLIDAASRRDAAGVRRCLDMRADPNFADTRGWTALHAASKLRPAWDVFNLLIPVSDLTARTKTGLMPVDIADKYGQADTAAVLREKMRCDPKGKHLVI
jgi:hypothetical protein